jgi:hypothetical protein
VKNLTKHTVARATSAFKWAQKRTGTAFDITFVPMPKDEREEAYMAIRQSSRGEADKTAFIVEISPEHVDAAALGKLRILAVHELLHAIWWPVIEVAENAVKGAARERVIAEIESATYICQRAICGDFE